MWRLAHGELPEKALPKVVVLLIGSTDLAGSSCTPDNANTTSVRIQFLIGFLHKRLPDSHVVVIALLPKGVRSDVFLLALCLGGV